MSGQRRIMLLGASVFCIRYIQALQEMNLWVLAVDMDPEAPAAPLADAFEPVNIVDDQACLRAARRYKVDGVLAINDFGVRTAAKVARSMGLPGLPVEVAEVATSKRLMRDVWRENGVPSVPYREVRSPADLRAAVEELGYPLIIKPVNSAGGGCRGIRRIDRGDDLSEAFEFADSFYRDQRLLVERFVQGLEHSVEVIVQRGVSHIIAISDKVKSPLPYRVDDTILYPTVENGQRMVQLQDAVSRSIRSVGIEHGMAHVELSITEHGPVLFELGARCGGGAPDPLVPYLTGINELQEAARIALGEPPTHVTPLYTKGCVIRFFYPTPGRIASIEGAEEARDLPGVLMLSLFRKPGDVVKPLRTGADRAGIVITGSETRDQALAAADQVIHTVSIRTQPVESTNP